MTTAYWRRGSRRWNAFPIAFVSFLARRTCSGFLVSNPCEPRRYGHPTKTSVLHSSFPPRVWVEDAEEGFVDEDENLEVGEVCLKSVKSFASGTEATSTCIQVVRGVDAINEHEHEHEHSRRFLSAGALIQRPRYPEKTGTRGDSEGTIAPICDAWMADAILNDGGPNLQLKGALQVLDELFLFHLQQQAEPHFSSSDGANSTAICSNIQALRNFVVHCGEDEYDDEELPFDARTWRSSCNVAASEMAAKLRGFVPLREMVKIDSIYHAHYYDHDLDGMVLDCTTSGLELYRNAETENNRAVQCICALLPDDDTIARHTTKRFSIGRKSRRSSEYDV